MPDISKCLGESSPIRENCYRYTSAPTPGQQSYAAFKYEYGSCPDVWPILSRSEVRRMDAQLEAKPVAARRLDAQRKRL